MMQIVIDIPAKLACEGFERPFTEEEKNVLIKAIGNGIALPKGHGRLIDADETLKRHCVDFCREKPSCYEDCLIYDLFYLAPTIIEADRAERSDKE